MSLAQFIQDAWQQQAKWLVVLRPLSLLYRGVSLLNQNLYRSGVKTAYTAPVPVMVIGNITVGGSGKTPLLIHLVKYLRSLDIRVGVISRGYGGKGPFPVYVSIDANVEVVGDEPTLIVQSTGVPMAVGPNRQKSIELLLSQHELDLIISDDGLQHLALNRQLEWIVLDNNRGLGNEKILPEGYLREPKSRLDDATVIEHATHPSSEQFYKTLESMSVTQFQCQEFPDHHDYEITDLQFDDSQPIITTEKDAVKLLPLLKQYPDFQREIWVVPVDAVLSSACYVTLHQQLKQLGLNLPERT